MYCFCYFFFFQAEDGIRDKLVTGVQTCALPIYAPIIRDHVAELNYLRHTPEMLDEAGGAAKGLARQVVDGDLTVVQIGVGDAGQVLEDEVLNDAQVLADRRGADLFVVADHEDRFSEIKCDQGHDVALAGFIDNQDVEARDAGIKIFDHAGKRHDPDGNGAAALAHFSGAFRAQQGDAHAVPFANAADGVEPADERLTLTRRRAPGLRRPCALVDKFDGHTAQLLAEFFAFGLQSLKRDARAAIEFIIELTPRPR